jgi:acetolactate synthase-1/2/3 large subunit
MHATAIDAAEIDATAIDAGQAKAPTKARMRAADALMRALEAEGVEVVFGYPGGAIMPIYDALRDSRIKHVLVRHEQGAALAANGYARYSGRVGVCMATSGPGATNLVTGIADAFLDSVPMVAITGQVPTSLMGTDAFQEVDIFGITMPIVKHSFLVRKAEELPSIVARAFAIAREGRPGPVLIDIPKDIANSEIAFACNRVQTSTPTASFERAAVARARALIEASERPLFYTGYGVGLANAEPCLRNLIRASGIPAVSTLKGLGGLPTDDPQFVGMLGMHGNQAANFAVQNADLLIVVGARFDDRATGKLKEFAPHAKIIHIDGDASEISKLRYANVHLVGDLNALLPQLTVSPAIDPWRQQVESWKQQHAWRYDAPGQYIYAPALLKELSAMLSPRGVLTCDVGQHQMWVAQHCTHRAINRHLTSGGLGTMGFGLPAAMGVYESDHEAEVVCVSGDGSIMMNIQELATLKRYQMPIKIVLLDNASLGMVRQWQELFFAERYSEVDLSDNPDFAELARAFGISARSIETRAQVGPALAEMLAHKGPFLLHVKIDPRANVWPLVPPNTANHHMINGQTQEQNS